MTQRVAEWQRKFPRLSLHSLRAKLLLFSFALVVVPGVVFAVIAIASARRALEDAVGRQLAEVAHDAAAEVSELLTRERKNVGIWARQDLMRQVLTGDVDRQISKFFIGLRESDAGYLELLCTDASGRVVAASDPARVGANHAQSDWYRAAAGGKDYLAGPVPLDGGGQALEIAAPVFDPEAPERVIGAVLGLYDWRRGANLAERIRQSEAALESTVDVLILDADGVVIAETRGEKFATLAGRDLRAAGWSVAQRPRPRAHPGYMREPHAAALLGFARLTGPRPDWTAVVLQPLHDALLPVSHMQRRLTLLLASVLLAGLGVAMLLADRMSRPLRELTRATREIGRVGATHRTVPVWSRDEIGQLAGAFNTMASALKRAQDDLVQAAKFAFVGEVAAGVAHEVRTPLGILRSSAQILARSLPQEQTAGAELVEMIIGEADRLDRVVAGLLELARPRELLIEPTPLDRVVIRALDFVDGQARERGITIERVLSAEPRPARCDPEQIYQVVLNLLVNALQILPPGGVITVRTLPAHDGRVGFEVSDNGPGIAPAVLGWIFTPFFTLREGGTGLGLALVQRIVQAHQGTVAVDSVVGRGTTFRIDLPAGEAA